MKESLRFAFAVSQGHAFEKKHFGEAEQFLIYEYRDDELSLIDEYRNPFIDSGEAFEHGSLRKGRALTGFLKELGIDVLVARQFGRNLHMVRESFIPVIISATCIGEVTEVLLKHIFWLKEEKRKTVGPYGLYRIDLGILKIPGRPAATRFQKNNKTMVR
jgi:predicted Fe-Mo cluster-binding NifX family protein